MEYQSGAIRAVESVEKGWELIKEDYWQFLGMSVVAGGITLAVAGVFGGINNVITLALGAGLSGQGRGEASGIAFSLVPQIVSMVISFFSNIVVVTVSGVLYSGIFAALAKKADTGVTDFGAMFSTISKWSACLIFAVLMAVVQLVFAIIGIAIGATVGVSALGLGNIASGNLDPAALGGVIFLIVAIIIVIALINFAISLLTTFVYPLFGDTDLSAGDAIVTSARAALSNLGGLILFWIVMALLILAGVIACFIGVIFVLPVMSASIFSAYRSVFPRAPGAFHETPPPPPVFQTPPPGYQPGY